MASMEYKVLALSTDSEAHTWEQKLNEASEQGYDWLQAVAGPGGETYVVMRKQAPGRARIL